MDFPLKLRQSFQRYILMLIALAFSCLSVFNVYAQSTHVSMQMQDANTASLVHQSLVKQHPTEQLASDMAAHCLHTHTEPSAKQIAPLQTMHHSGCLDCQLMHCQTLNYALAEPSVSLALQQIVQVKPQSYLPDYVSHVLVGYWQQILRPPKA